MHKRGDTLFLHGSVTGTYASHGTHDMECALVAENQEGALRYQAQ